MSRAAARSSRSRSRSSTASAPSSGARRARRRCGRSPSRGAALSSPARAARKVLRQAAETVVDEDRHPQPHPARFQLPGEQTMVGVGPGVARGGRAPLDLGDRGQARAGERVAEPHAATSARENAISSSSRSSGRARVDGLPGERRAPRAGPRRVRTRRSRPPRSAGSRRARRRSRPRRPRGSGRVLLGRAARELGGVAAGTPSSTGSISRSRTSPPTTSQTRFGPAGESSSIPPAPWTTNARRAPSFASTAAIVRTSPGA